MSDKSISKVNNLIPPSHKDLEDDFWAVFNQRITQFSEKIAVKSTTTTLTFFMLNQLANHIAAEITARYGRKNKGIALFMADGAKLSASFIGILKSQNYIVPLDPSFPVSRLNFMLNDSESKVILTDEKNYKQAISCAIQPEAVINIDALNYQRSLPNPYVAASAKDITQIVYTSGTTGDPKGVVLNYRYYWRAIQYHIRTHQTGYNDRIGNLTSYTFGSPYTHTLACLINGATFYPYHIKHDGLSGLARWLKDEKITYFIITPALFRKFVNMLEPDETFPDVRLFALGAEKKLLQDVKSFRKHFTPECKMNLKYVSSETYVVSYHVYDYDHGFKDEVLPAGFPLDDIDLYIWDSEGKEVPRGEVGEIVVRGDALAQGYWHQPELTRQKFLPDPHDPGKTIVRTGDLGKILPDGQLQHVGRLDDLVKIKGIRIELSSIENHILAYPGVVQSAAKAFEDNVHNMKLVAYFVPEEGVTISKSDLRKFLAERLPFSMLPHYLIDLKTIPLTESNKIDRKALPLPDLSRPKLENPYIPPKDALENKLVKIWEDNIGIQGIGVTDKYFELGGDSLSAVMLFVQIEQIFKRRLPVSILLTHPTIRKMIEILQQVDTSAAWSPILALKPQGDAPPLFFIPGRGGFPIRFQYLASRLNSANPLYAMQSWGAGKKHRPFYTIEAMASYFISEMQKINPHGPYHLCGESGGGTIAYEMAQQLKVKGEQVPILVMLDTYGSEQTGMLQFPKTKKAKLAHRIMLVKKHSQILLDSDWEGRKAYLKYIWELMNRRWEIRQHDHQWGREIKEESAMPVDLRMSERENVKALQRYQPKPYPGRVILFRAQRNPVTIDETNGWNKVGLGELIVHNLDCYHGNILFDPAVSQVAKLLDAYLAE